MFFWHIFRVMNCAQLVRDAEDFSSAKLYNLINLLEEEKKFLSLLPIEHNSSCEKRVNETYLILSLNDNVGSLITHRKFLSIVFGSWLFVFWNFFFLTKSNECQSQNVELLIRFQIYKNFEHLENRNQYPFYFWNFHWDKYYTNLSFGNNENLSNNSKGFGVDWLQHKSISIQQYHLEWRFQIDCGHHLRMCVSRSCHKNTERTYGIGFY